MRKISVALIAMTLALPLGCSTTKKITHTTVKAAETAGTATYGSAKTVGGTSRGLVTGGTQGAKEEYQTGAHETATKTHEKASQTRDAAHGEAPPPSE